MAKNKKQVKQRFLVVSYDSDQQQWFYDYVLAAEVSESRFKTMRR